MSVQVDYNTYAQAGYPGDLARPGEPFAFDTGLAQVPTGGRRPRPGDPVYYDAGNNGFAVPTTAEQNRQVVGIVSYDPGIVQGQLASRPANANSDQFIEFADGDELKIITFGTVWVVAGSAMEYAQRLVQDNVGSTADFLWDPYTVTVPASFANLAAARTALDNVVSELGRRVVECVSPSPVVANGLAQVRIGYGRAV